MQFFGGVSRAFLSVIGFLIGDHRPPLDWKITVRPWIGRSPSAPGLEITVRPWIQTQRKRLFSGRYGLTFPEAAWYIICVFSMY
jgi:hypothetical protein